jgi:hypothetical protein
MLSNSVPVSQNMHVQYVYAVYAENLAKRTSTLCWQFERLFNVKADGITCKRLDEEELCIQATVEQPLPENRSTDTLP